MAVDEQVMDALRQGLKLEQDGYAFYRGAAAALPDGPAKEALLSLAEDEKVHEAIIVRQMQALQEDGGFAAVPGLDLSGIDLGERYFPRDRQAVQARVEDIVTELDALQMGLEVEMASHEHYRHMSQSTADEQGRDMYLWLASAELMHFDTLMSIYRGLNQRENWV